MGYLNACLGMSLITQLRTAFVAVDGGYCLEPATAASARQRRPQVPASDGRKCPPATAASARQRRPQVPASDGRKCPPATAASARQRRPQVPASDGRKCPPATAASARQRRPQVPTSDGRKCPPATAASARQRRPQVPASVHTIHETHRRVPAHCGALTPSSHEAPLAAGSRTKPRKHQRSWRGGRKPVSPADSERLGMHAA
ncbi:cyclic GMP-AMP synthase-like [Procambarus clarkii]|uniref:cyclic GMP-AMP synthase-like n=1 Tax=Procambarus clarkii TaxID=6728 RepID=UPI0037449B7F